MRISLCICTMDRPTLLERCLQSVAQAAPMPHEVVVSDDSVDRKATMEACKRFSFVKYVHGPRRGLCANRNCAARACSGDYIALLDDDLLMSPDFVRIAATLASQSDGHTIFAGRMFEGSNDTVVEPTKPTFWGHFNHEPERLAPETITLSNLFPRSAFQVAEFDERIAYGYEDMDLCSQLLALGYRIEYRPELVNTHLSPPHHENKQRQLYFQAEWARFYTSLKRYYLWQRKPLKAIMYVLLAVAHKIGHCVKERKYAEAVHVMPNMASALATLWDTERQRRQSISR